jgi:hypothetical protein
MFIDHLGWIATAVFVLSYFCRSAAALRFFQMAGATFWIAYGVIIGASPVVVANVLVFSAAAWTAFRARRAVVHKLGA